MGERKVLNKYYPPDFDPRLIPPKKRDKLNTMKVRMMLPFSLRCTSCGEYMCLRPAARPTDRAGRYRGKKFNSKKEDVPEEKYLGIMVFRFYVNCVRCNALVSFKTDPKNSDYVCEHGASRNFEPWRARLDAEEEQQVEQEEKEKVDAMNRLERVTKESKRELDILDALDEVKMMNAANNLLTVDQLLNNLKEADSAKAKAASGPSQLQDEEDRKQAQAAFAASATVTKRIEEPQEPGPGKQQPEAPKGPSLDSIWGRNIIKQQQQDTPTPSGPFKHLGGKPVRRGVIGVKRKAAAVEPAAEPAAAKPAEPKSSGLGGLLAGYGSSGSGSDSPGQDSPTAEK